MISETKKRIMISLTDDTLNKIDNIIKDYKTKNGVTLNKSDVITMLVHSYLNQDKSL